MIGAAILGIVAGFLARALLPGKQDIGFFPTVLVGLAGALAGFFIFTELLGIGDTEIFDLGGLVGAVIGAMIVLLLYQRATQGSAEATPAIERSAADRRQASAEREHQRRGREH